MRIEERLKYEEIIRLLQEVREEVSKMLVKE